MFRCIQILLICIPLSGFSQKTNKKCFKLPPLLQEVSGLYLQDAQTFWWHNDSGAAPHLYKTDGRGNPTDTVALPTLKNNDWEDLTHDPTGNLYIGDFGNNGNRRRNLQIYIYHPQTKVLDSILFTYPDQTAFPPADKAHWNFDMEAFFWHNDQLHLFSKNRVGVGNHYCKHYTLSDQPGDQVATLVDSIYLKKRVVTAAAISPDGKTVALLAYDYKKLFGFFPTSAASIFYLTDFKDNRFLKGRLRKRRAPSFILATQFEALDFLDDDTLYIASEQTKFIRPKARRVRIR